MALTLANISFGGKTEWRVSQHSLWATPHGLTMQSCPCGATPHEFLCGVAPVGQLGMEGILAFYTGRGAWTSWGGMDSRGGYV